MLGLQFVRDVSEFRPAWRCAGAALRSCGSVDASRALPALLQLQELAAQALAARASSPRPAPHRAADTRFCSADHVLAFCEEAHKRRMLREGKPYTGKLLVRADGESTLCQLDGGAPSALCCLRTQLPLFLSYALLRSAWRLAVCSCSRPALSQDRNPADRLKAPRMVKWKLDRLF